jgi:hypothetical protein
MIGSPELSTYPSDDEYIFELQEVCLMRFEGSMRGSSTRLSRSLKNSLATKFL